MKNRVQSVDFLRGLTILAMILVNTPGDWSYVYTPLLHAKWNGLTVADFVFPFFLFIVGISISFVYKSKKGNASVYKKIVIRSVKLILLGLFLNAFLPYYPFIVEIENVRLPGVLQRIGIVFLVASVLYLNMPKKLLFVFTGILLIVYWIWLAYIPLPNGMLPTLESGINNWTSFIDLQLLGSHMWKPTFDPEGLVSTIPSITSAIIGIFIGEILMSAKKNKHLHMFIIGVGFLCIGYFWSIFFPINKRLWSSSFVLVTSGYATILLAGIYYLTDFKGYRLGTVFNHVGANAIILYFASMFIGKSFYLIKVNEQESIHGWLYNTFFVYDAISNTFSSLLYALVVICFYVIMAYWLYLKKIFIKV